MSILVAEGSKNKHARNISWDKVSEALNAKGPLIKTASDWRKVSMKTLVYCLTNIRLVLFSGFITIDRI